MRKVFVGLDWAEDHHDVFVEDDSETRNIRLTLDDVADSPFFHQIDRALSLVFGMSAFRFTTPAHSI
jgi:hypothetical protein